MSKDQKDKLDQAFISLISEFDHSLKLEETTIMDEKVIDQKFIEHANVQRQFVEEQTNKILEEMMKMNKKTEDDFDSKLKKLHHDMNVYLTETLNLGSLQNLQGKVLPKVENQSQNFISQPSTSSGNTEQNQFLQAMTNLLNKVDKNQQPRITLGNQPTFSGKETESIEEWIRITTKIFRINRIDESFYVDIASSYLRDKAERAFLQISKSQYVTWDIFQDEMNKQFGRRDMIEVTLSKFRSLSQSGDLKEYIDELNTRLLLLKEELPESYKIDFFRNGLKPIIRAGVMAGEPKTLRDCIDKAIQIYYSG